MRTLAKYTLLVLVAGAATAAAAAPTDIEFHGYARAGVGLAGAGGGQVCFGLAGADTKYRLGNECDYTLEPTFTSRFARLDDKSAWGIVAMPSFYRTYTELDSFDNLPVRFGQIYLFGENVPYLLDGRIWGGRRFYDRLQTGINDQFLENEDGDGAGIEDMDVKVGRLSVAFLMNPNDEAVTVPAIDPDTGDPLPVATGSKRQYKVTGRLTGVKTARGGALQLWAGYTADTLGTDAIDTEVGGAPATVPVTRGNEQYRVAVYHTLPILGGSNLVGAKVEMGRNHQLWRVVLQQGLMVAPLRTGIDFITEFRSKQDRSNRNASWVQNDWFSIGARTDTHLVGPFRMLFEAGHDRVKPEGGSALQLTKLTAAAAVSAGPDPGSRPTFRLFYTHAFWNDAAKGAGGVFEHGQSGTRLQQVYGDKNNGGSVGVQAEAWW